ncbi:unnamed protein product [Camellia sinensis]
MPFQSKSTKGFASNADQTRPDQTRLPEKGYRSTTRIASASSSPLSLYKPSFSSVYSNLEIIHRCPPFDNQCIEV